MGVHRKVDYKKKIKQGILESYDATMWTGLPE